MNKQDYQWIKQSRAIILAQCEDLTNEEFTREHDFALSNVKETLIHMTKCYRNWVGSYLLGNDTVGDFPKEQIDEMDLGDVKKLFELVDSYVYDAIDQYEHSMNDLLETTSVFKKNLELKRTPHHILLHAFTHEFHHKGQVTAMFHLMGHKSKNTNMIEFESVTQ